MTQSVIDALEVVEIEIKHRKLSSPPYKREFLFQLLAEQHAVGKICQRIVMGEVGNPCLGGLALGHVIDDSQHILGRIAFIPDSQPSRENAAHAIARRQNLALIE